MSVHLPDHNLSYFSVPKCACTSLKHFFFEIENGRPFRRFTANGKLRTVHTACYPSVEFSVAKAATRPEHWKFAVIRDPLARFMACYSNRVAHFGMLKNARLTASDKRLGLVTEPDLPTFVRFFDRYRELSADILHHTRPLRFFLGRDPEYFDRIYTLGELDSLIGDVAARVGETPALKQLQTGGPNLKPEALTASETKRVTGFFKDDYRLFGRSF